MNEIQRDAKKYSNPSPSDPIDNNTSRIGVVTDPIPLENWKHGKFQEKYTTKDPNEYVRHPEKEPGRILIYNFTFEDDPSKIRQGTKFDAETLICTFGRLGFNVKEDHIHNDLKRKEVMETLENVLKNDNETHSNCFIVVFLTHGSNDDELETSDFPIYVNEIWNKIDQCENLKNVPKLFLIQACKGEGVTAVDNADEKFNIVSNNFFKGQTPPDTLTVFATREGSVSYRHTDNGSWFIQEFCKNVLSYGKFEDVDSLITRTAKCVANIYFNTENGNITKQMPTSVSTLTKKFYLTTNKHRQMLWDDHHKNELIIQMLRERIDDIDDRH